MAIGKSLRRILPRAVGALALGALTAGCGISPGDYVIYRVAFAEQDLSSGCYYPNDSASPNEKSDNSDIRATATFIIYAGIEDQLYLDTGEATLVGAESDAGYTFNGKTVDVEYDSPDGTGSKRTTTNTITIDITVDGNAVNGKSTVKTSFKCTGATCGNPIPSCTKSTEFVGTEVDDIQLEHAI